MFGVEALAVALQVPEHRKDARGEEQLASGVQVEEVFACLAVVAEALEKEIFRKMKVFSNFYVALTLSTALSGGWAR